VSPARSPALPPALLPYTTLFRSQAWPRTCRNDNLVSLYNPPGRSRELFRPRKLYLFCDECGVVQFLVPVGSPAFRDSIDARESTDRKSTRLNSSPVSISYVVLWL